MKEGNNKLRTILELFHIARREAQIIDKLRTCLNDHQDLYENIADTLRLYAPRKNAELYIYKNRIGRREILKITSSSLKTPAVLDMKPIFMYCMGEITSVSYKGEIRIESYTWYSDLEIEHSFKRIPDEEFMDYVKAFKIKRFKTP